MVGEPRQRALHERGDRRSAFVIEQLAVGQAAVIVDDGVKVVVAEFGDLLGVRAATQVSNVFTVAKLLPLLGIAIGGLIYLAGGHGIAYAPASPSTTSGAPMGHWSMVSEQKSPAWGMAT
jgi:hypothetical protein